MATDLTGRRFGRLTALEPTKERKNGYTVWRCRCDCGNELLAESRHLKRGTLLDCGCTTVKFRHDLTNLRFGKLLVLHKTEKRAKYGTVIWHCRCDCGNEIDKSRSQLLENKYPNCGCLPTTVLIGRRFGQRTVIEYAGKQNGFHYWLCRHDNGKESVVRQNNLLYRSNSRHSTNSEPLNKSHSISKLSTRNTSGVVGVTWKKNANKWEANITIQGKRHYLGIYSSKDEAINARRKAEEHWYQIINE